MSDIRLGKRQLLALCLACGLSSAAWADYPEKPITLIVPWAAGGGTDATARIIASSLKEELGQTVNVVNRTGGSGVVGHTAIARARPDGYTIGMATVELNMMHWQGLTDITFEDFTPIAQLNFDYAGLYVGSDSPYNDLEALTQAIDSQAANSFNASGTGLGGIWHVALAGYLMDRGIAADKTTWVPTQGSAPALTELAAGGVDLVACSLPEARSMIEAGKIRSLGVMAPERLDGFPDVPTLEEAVDSDVVMGAWRGIVAPKGLDEATVNTLEKALQAAYQSDEFQDFMDKRGFGTEWKNAQAFQTFMAEQDKQFGNIMKETGLAR